jgi:hypothetical protein
MKTRTTTRITKELKNIKSCEDIYCGTSRKDVFVGKKKVTKGVRKAALHKLQGDDVKTTTSIKTYDMDWNLIKEDIKVEDGSYMKLVKEAIKGYRNSNYKY